LRQAWAQFDNNIHVHHFASLQDWQQAFVETGFSRIDLRTDKLPEQHGSVRELLMALKAMGAHNNNAGKPSGMTGKQKLKSLYNAYEQYRLPNGNLPATWQIISGTVIK
jgi:malonyl-CoA O-methyltransferase